MKIFVLPGWGFNSKIFNKLKGDIVPIEWSDILDSKNRKQFIEQIPKDSLLICWSLSVFLLLPYINQIKSSRILFISAGSSYTKNLLTPKGAQKHVIDDMIIDLNKNKKKCLEIFFTIASYPISSSAMRLNRDDYLQNNLQTKLLIDGLNFLRKTNFLKMINNPERITLLQGDKDIVFHKSGAKLFAEKYELNYIEIKGGGHLLPYSHSYVIQKWIEK